MTRQFDESLVHKERLPTGEIEMMPFEHIDVAVVNRIGDVLDKIKMPRFASWRQRPRKERVMLGEFESPKRFLLAMAKAGVSKNQLPAVYVTREPGLAFADQSTGGRAMTGIGNVVNDEGVVTAQLDQAVLSLTYVVTFVGWQDADIEPLVALYLIWLRTKGTDRLLEIKTTLVDAQLIVQGKFSDGPLASAAPASAPYEQDKLRSLSVTVTVEVDYLQAQLVDEFDVTTDFSLSAAGSD